MQGPARSPWSQLSFALALFAVCACLAALAGCDARPAQKAASDLYDSQPPGRITLIETGKVMGTMKPGSFKKGDELVVVRDRLHVGVLEVTGVYAAATFRADIITDDGIKGNDHVFKRE